MAATKSIVLWALVLCAQACAKDEAAAPTNVPAAPAASAPVLAPIAAPADVVLAPQRFERARLAFDGLAQVAPDLTPWDVGGVFFQGRNLATSDEVIRILVRAHGDETLDGFERDHKSYALSARMPIKVCGRPAQLIRATRPEEHIACVIVAGGPNHPAYIPPTEVVALGFEHAQLRVVMTIDISAAKPDSYKDLTAKIIGSIRCL